MLTTKSKLARDENVVVADDLLPAALLKSLQKYFETKVRWEFGSQSDRVEPQFGHWNADFLEALPDSQFNVEQRLFGLADAAPLTEVWLCLQKSVLKGHQLVRLYANAHTYGTEGYPHTDTRRAGNRSTVIYLNPTWDVGWAGETFFANELNDVVYSVLPRPGRVISFDGRILHGARSVSRRCPALRVCLVIKSKLEGAQDDDLPLECLEALRSWDTDKVYHSRRSTKYDHLISTANILRSLGAESATVHAGLFHSVYLEPNRRHVTRADVAAVVGEQVESLVFAFSLYPRNLVEEWLVGDPTAAARRVLQELPGVHSELRCLSLADLERLIQVEFANLVEQRTLERFPNLTRFAQSRGYLDERGFVASGACSASPTSIA